MFYNCSWLFSYEDEILTLRISQFLRYIDSLLFLIYAYQNNKELLSKGQYRGHDEELLSHYRRECLLVSLMYTVCACFVILS